MQKQYKETLRKIREYRHILSSQKNMDVVIKEDLDTIKAEFAEPRRTVLEDSEEAVYVEVKEAAKEVIFVMDRFGYCKTLEKTVYERNLETVQTENVHVIPIMTDDKICLFTDSGQLYQTKISDVPAGKVKDKGTPIENISKFDGSKERILLCCTSAVLSEKKILFATEQALVKVVAGDEFVTSNRMVAATKLTDDDKVSVIRFVDSETEVVLQTKEGMFLRFALEEIPLLKKNTRGVRGMKLESGDVLDQVYFPDSETKISYKGKEVHLNKLKIAKRDGKGSKVRL